MSKRPCGQTLAADSRVATSIHFLPVHYYYSLYCDVCCAFFFRFPRSASANKQAFKDGHKLAIVTCKVIKTKKRKRLVETMAHSRTRIIV